MSVTFTTYRSFFVSCFVHACMLFVILYIRRQEYSPEKFFTTSATPAKVQMQTIPMGPPQPVPAPATSTPINQTQPPSSDSIYTEENLETIADPQEEPHQEKIHESSLPGTISNYPISKDTFMKAFSSAIQHERRRIHSSKPQEGYRGHEHVQERLQEWAEHHYKERIIRALRSASITTSSKMRFERSVKKMVTIRIPILKDGTIGRLTTNDLTGIPEVDTHLMKVLHVTDFPPIPEHYGSDTYVFPLSFMVYLQEGSELYHLYV